MAGVRKGGREQGKSDPIDALAVARAAQREDDLPVARLEGEVRQVRLLVDHRDDLVRERTRIQCRLRWHLHELFPGLEIPPKSLRRQHMLTELEARLAAMDGTVARIARELLVRCRELTVRANELEREIAALVKRLGPSLLALPGCGVLSAAKIIGETSGAGRFRSRAAFARWNGTAPVPVWSGNNPRFRLSRGGNRQVNAALHRIAITQWRGVGDQGRGYVERRIATGSTKTEALRLLRRRLSDEIFRRLLLDESGNQVPVPSDFPWRLDIGATRRPGEGAPLHRGGESRRPQRRQGVWTARGLPCRLLCAHYIPITPDLLVHVGKFCPQAIPLGDRLLPVAGTEEVELLTHLVNHDD
jgi:transposase